MIVANSVVASDPPAMQPVASDDVPAGAAIGIAAPPADAAAAVAVDARPAAPQPAGEASLGASLLARLGDAQAQHMQRHQMLADVSSRLTTSIAELGKHVWSTLRGTE